MVEKVLPKCADVVHHNNGDKHFSARQPRDGIVAQTVPPDLPLAIICLNEGTQIWGIADLATVRKDGSATYLPPTGQLAATVNAKRMVEPPQDRPAVFDCFGKTLDELRAIGRIIEFQRTR